MRIALWHNLPSGGGKRALHDQVHGLVARGHTIEAWCPSTADREYLPLASVATEHVLPIAPHPLSGPLRRLLRLAGARSETYERILAMDAHARQFAGVVHAGRFDVVFASSCRWFCTPFAGRYLDVPSVLYLQEPCRRLYESASGLPWLAEEASSRPWWHPQTTRRWLGSAARVDAIRVQGREEFTSIRAFDRVLVNSRFSRESVRRALGADARVCYLGVDTVRFRESRDARDAFVLSVGEFGWHKDPLFVIRAVGSSQHKPKLTWLANRVNAECLAAANQLAGTLGVSLQVRASASEDELVEAYQRASIFLYAPCLEPFGLAPLEANACGTPVVVVGEGGVRETVAHMDNGLVVDHEPAEMGAAIDSLMGNPSLARDLGQNGAKRVREAWTLDAATDRLEAHLIAVARRPM